MGSHTLGDLVQMAALAVFLGFFLVVPIFGYVVYQVARLVTKLAGWRVARR